mgnify:CR=1 FL=1
MIIEFDCSGVASHPASTISFNGSGTFRGIFSFKGFINVPLKDLERVRGLGGLIMKPPIWAKKFRPDGERTTLLQFLRVLPSTIEVLSLEDVIVHRTLNLQQVPRLRVLSISGTKVARFEKLDCCPMLEELRFSGNEIKRIEHLDCCPKLKVLDLDSNKIGKISNLDEVPNLHTLIISNNRIKKIQGLENLQNLQRLYLRGNKIQKIEGLGSLSNLQVLDLNDNTFLDQDLPKINVRRRGQSLDTRDAQRYVRYCKLIENTGGLIFNQTKSSTTGNDDQAILDFTRELHNVWKYEEAITFLERYIDDYDHNDILLRALGYTHIANGDNSAAIRVFGKLDDQREEIIGLLATQFNEKMWRTAWDTINKISEKYPEDPDILLAQVMDSWQLREEKDQGVEPGPMCQLAIKSITACHCLARDEPKYIVFWSKMLETSGKSQLASSLKKAARFVHYEKAKFWETIPLDDYRWIVEKSDPFFDLL